MANLRPGDYIQLRRPVWAWYGRKCPPGSGGFLVEFNFGSGWKADIIGIGSVYLLEDDFNVLVKGENG